MGPPASSEARFAPYQDALCLLRPLASATQAPVSSDNTDNNTWYVRRGATILGPYHVDTLRRYLLLGRVRVTDRVSADGHCWQPLTHRGELIPDEMQDLGSAEGRARFEAARQAVDERRGGDDGEAARRRPPRRRQTDLPPRTPGVRGVWTGLVVTAVIVLAAIGYQDVWVHGPAGPPDCEAPAEPRVNWSYCTKDGLELPPGHDIGSLRAVNASLRNARVPEVDLREATLAYADLAGADLSGAVLDGADLEGAVLRGADLRGASFEGARLTHADLRDARIEGADFADAELDNVVWPEGTHCRERPDEACPG